MPRWLWIGLAGLFGLVGAGYGVLLAINRADEPPSATARAYRALLDGPVHVHDIDDALPYLIGIGAPRGEDPRAHGLHWMKWSQLTRAEQEERMEPRNESLHAQVRHHESGIHALVERCKEPDADCLTSLREHPDVLRNGLEETAWMLERYDRLIRHETWHEMLPVGYPVFPPHESVVMLNWLSGFRVWRLASEGQLPHALDLLDREARFWRLALTESNTLIGKMVVTAILRRNLSWTAASLQHAEDGRDVRVPEAWQKTLMPEERSMRRVFAGELHMVGMILEEGVHAEDVPIFDRLIWRVMSPLLKRQATINLYAERYERIDRALEVPFAALPASIASLRGHESEIAAREWFRIYNPVGHSVYVQGLGFDHVEYGLRVADLEGARRMLLLVAGLRADGAKGEDIGHRLTSSEIRDPYTGDAFEWNPTVGAIAFVGMASGDRGAIRYSY